MYYLDLLHISDSELFSSASRIEMIHKDKSEQGTAYSLGEKIRIKFYLKRRIAAAKVGLIFYSDDERTQLTEVDAEWRGFEMGEDIYYAELKLPVGLYFFLIKISGFGDFYGYKSNGEVAFSREKEGKPKFQITVSDFIYKKPNELYGGIIYHIFVDRFNRGETPTVRDGGVLIEDWYADIPEFPEYPGAYMKNNSFFGGTLYGIAEKLDYLSSLGVSIIYLSPIFESASNHKYDTADYMTVDKGFGGDAALNLLIQESKKRKIGIILDGVFNHTGSDSIYFNKLGKYDSLGAYQSKESKYFNWYEFKSFPDKYTCWWGIDILPRINTHNRECFDFFVGNSGVIKKYSNLGILGFRLDVADELSDRFISAIKKALEERRDSPSLLYGEVWEDASNKIAYENRKHYYLGDELDGVMNYPLREGIIGYIKHKNTEGIKYAFEILMNMPRRIRNMTMNLLGTHDTERIITVLGGESAENKTNAYLKNKRMTDSEYSLGKQRLLASYTLLATLPGIPTIFYGDEAGLEGYGDPFNRRCFPWGKEDTEILTHYRKIGKIRRENAVYREGSFEVLFLTEELLIFRRRHKITECVTVFNNSQQKIEIEFEISQTELLTGKKGTSFRVNPTSALIFKCGRRGKITVNERYLEFP